MFCCWGPEIIISIPDTVRDRLRYFGHQQIRVAFYPYLRVVSLWSKVAESCSYDMQRVRDLSSYWWRHLAASCAHPLFSRTSQGNSHACLHCFIFSYFNIIHACFSLFSRRKIPTHPPNDYFRGMFILYFGYGSAVRLILYFRWSEMTPPSVRLTMVLKVNGTDFSTWAWWEGRQLFPTSVAK